MVGNLKDFIEDFAESELLSYSYKTGLLVVVLETLDKDQVEINIETNLVIMSWAKVDRPFLKGLMIETELISNFLPVENGIYNLPKSFQDMMKAEKNGMTTAIGKRESLIKFQIGFITYHGWIRCFVNDETVSKLIKG